MEIRFKSKRLHKQLTTETTMVAKHGPKRARLLQRRLAEIRASANLGILGNLPGPRLHALTGNRRGQMSVDLDHPYRLILVPDHDPVPELPTGGTDLRKVARVMIIEIADTHE